MDQSNRTKIIGFFKKIKDEWWGAEVSKILGQNAGLLCCGRGSRTTITATTEMTTSRKNNQLSPPYQRRALDTAEGE